jgi:flagellar export protein FliJ
MTRLEKVTRVAEIAEQRAEVATHKLAERVRGVASNEAQLVELNRFRSEYANKSGDGDAAVVAVAELMNRHRFLGRVDEAIAFQRAEVERQQRLLANEQVACGRVRAKSRALDNAVRRIGDVETRKRERFEQSQLDERAQRSSGSFWDLAANDAHED